LPNHHTNQPIPSGPVTKTQHRIHTPKHANTETPPTYPFPAYKIVNEHNPKEQNDGTKFPVAKRSRLTNHAVQINPGQMVGGGSV
jgi:hypothetical protein